MMSIKYLEEFFGFGEKGLKIEDLDNQMEKEYPDTTILTVTGMGDHLNKLDILYNNLLNTCEKSLGEEKCKSFKNRWGFRLERRRLFYNFCIRVKEAIRKYEKPEIAKFPVGSTIESKENRKKFSEVISAVVYEEINVKDVISFYNAMIAATREYAKGIYGLQRKYMEAEGITSDDLNLIALHIRSTKESISEYEKHITTAKSAYDNREKIKSALDRGDKKIVINI